MFGNLIDYGAIFENLVLNTIKEKIKLSGISIHFYRTKDKAEVDFILNAGEKIIPIEVKYRIKKPVLERSMKSFIEKYSPLRAIIINLSFKEKIKVGNTEVLFIPFWDIVDSDNIDFIY